MLHKLFMGEKCKDFTVRASGERQTFEVLCPFLRGYNFVDSIVMLIFAVTLTSEP